MDGGKVVKKEGKMDGGFRACVDGLFAPDADNKQRFPQRSTWLVGEPVSHDGGGAAGRNKSRNIANWYQS